MTRIRFETPQLDRVVEQLDRLIWLNAQIAKGLGVIIQNQEEVMADLSDLEAEVSQNNDAIQSAVALMNGLSQQLKDALASGDPAAVQALVDQLDAQTQTLADAVAANTPADPNAPAPEEPPA